MKTELLKIAQDLEQGTITDKEARTLLLGLLGVSVSFDSFEFDMFDNGVKNTICDRYNWLMSSMEEYHIRLIEDTIKATIENISNEH
jgi:hypothetical protein